MAIFPPPILSWTRAGRVARGRLDRAALGGYTDPTTVQQAAKRLAVVLSYVKVATMTETLDPELLTLLVCPESHARLVQVGDWLYSTDPATRRR